MIIQARINNYIFPLEVEFPTDKTLRINFKYHPDLVNEVKSLEGASFDPDTKSWTVTNSERNIYSLNKLEKNYDERYDKWVEYRGATREGVIKLKQQEMLNHILSRFRCIIAGEPGTGKTLATIEALEKVNGNILIVAPRSAHISWELEFRKWNAQDIKNRTILTTPNKVEQVLLKGIYPDHLIVDEAHYFNNPQARRTEALLLLSKFVKGLVVLLTGTPTPKDPSNWWSLCEICQPGFLRESSKQKLAKRLGEYDTNVKASGQQYSTLKFWKKSEIENLNKRLAGMVLPVFLKDCVDLPDKIYKQIRFDYTEKDKKIVQLISNSGDSAIQILNNLRQFSDGFQYDNESIQLTTPKDEYIEDVLKSDEQDRLILFAGFQASIDKLVDLANKCKWHHIRIDGRGLATSLDRTRNPIETFQSDIEMPIVYIGHPLAGGVSLTLTKSQRTIFYSNDFNGAARIQAEGRNYRIGTTKCVIEDLFWLPSDEYIFNNLQRKKDLQAATLGELKNFMEEWEKGEYK